jgi:sugar phosphate isomerase/epimerase
VRLSVITDEIDDDLGLALDVCDELGIRAVELRSIDSLNVVEHPPEAQESMRADLDRRNFEVCAIASPFLKCHRGGDHSTAGELRNAPARSRAEQQAVLTRALATAQVMSAPVVRAFSYWRERDPLGAVPQLARELRQAATTASEAGLTLALENEHECNVASSHELLAVLDEAPSPKLGVIWDPANAAKLAPRAFRGLGGFERIRDRVVHVHLKDVDVAGRWVRIGEGLVDHAALLHNLQATGYAGFLSIETHYRRDGSGAAATRECVEALRAIAGDAGIELTGGS